MLDQLSSSLAVDASLALQNVQGAQAPRIAGGDAARTAQDFEAFFLTQVLESMSAGVETGAFGGGSAEKTWRSFFHQEAAREMTARGGIGLSAQLQAEIIAMQARGER